MPNFISTNPNQNVMLVLNFRDQIQFGTFEFALQHLIDTKLDLSVFYPRYQNDQGGRPAYDPALLLKVILFAYSRGIKTSRDIQWNCENNIVFKALACDQVPHFTTIAAFISERSTEVENIFEQILLICDQQGLLGKELFAIDGCKMPSDAAKEHSGTLKELEEKRDKIKRQIRHHLSEHKRLDKHESRDAERLKREQQTIETLDKAYDRIDTFLKSASPRMGKGKRPREVKSNITDNESCKMTTSKGTIQGYTGVATADKKHQIIVDAQSFGEGQEHHLLQPVLEQVKERLQRLGISENIYQDGVIVTADTGYANEDNMKYLHDHQIDGYIPDKNFRSRDPNFTDQKAKYGKKTPRRHHDNEPKLFVAGDFQFDPVNKTCRCPAGEDLWLWKEGIDDCGNLKLFFEGRLSKCRSCQLKHQCMRNPEAANSRKGHGRHVSFIIESKRAPNYTDWMKHRVDSERGKHIYSHRMSVVEPVFANIGINKRLNRFSLRSRRKVQGQWQLYCMVHNIEKLANYGKLAA